MDAVEDIKSRLSIEDVVGDYLELKRSGRNLKGLSPFTSERTPSFMVSPEKQIWHDFSSGKGGNMFSFVMEIEGLDFKGALELLARKASIDLSQYRSARAGSNSKLKERLYAANEAATRFYQVQFSKNNIALEYALKKRGFTKDIALEFRLGYSPSNGAALYDFLAKRGFKDDELKKAGLITIRYNRPSDMFRGRLMVPLMDAQGRVIGFTARLLDDQPDAPKYINTPQSILYDKSRHIYGFHLAKDAIRRTEYCVVVEGNLDVIAAHQAGTRQVVATAGTALTEAHVKVVSHFTDDIRLCFDQDKAGQTAAERSIGVAGKVGVSLYMIDIPAGKDPDDLIKEDLSGWIKTIDKPLYAPDWLIARYEKQLDITTGPGKREFSDIVLRLIKSMKDDVERDHYVGVLSEKLQVSKDALRTKLSQTMVETRRLKKIDTHKLAKAPIDVSAVERQKLQDHLLALAMFQPALRGSLLQIHAEIFETDTAKKIVAFLKENPTFSGDVSEAVALKDVAEYVKILSLQFEELYRDLDLVELRDEALRIKTRLIEQYVKYKKQAIMSAYKDADEQKQAELLTKANQLDTLLRH
ncbi:DNA primase [soil metagenome]